MNLFQMLASLLGNSDKVILTIEKGGNNKLSVLATPELGPPPEGASDTELAYRAALATPFRMVATADELDAEFINSLNEYLQRRKGYEGDMNSLLAQKEAGKLARKSAEAAKSDNHTSADSKGDAPSPEAVGDAPKPEFNSDKNPESLF